MLLKKGIIIADDQNGKKLALIKNELKYAELKEAGKVNEIAIDQSWDIFLRATNAHEDDNYLEYWNKLVLAAYKANHGLLVINISNIKVFGHCWHLKQLAKQEREIQLWSNSFDIENSTEAEFIAFAKKTAAEFGEPLTTDQLFELIEGFMFDGYVLLVINDLIWDDVKKHATLTNCGQFEAMMQFYHRV